MVSCVLITSNSNGSMHNMQTQTSEQTVWTWINFDDDGAPPVGHLGVVFPACVDTGSGNGHFHGFVYHWKSKDRCSFSDCSEASGYIHLWWSAILLPDLLGLLMCVDIICNNLTVSCVLITSISKGPTRKFSLKQPERGWKAHKFSAGGMPLRPLQILM